MAKKQSLTERFQQLAGIKPLYELDERPLQVSTNDGETAIITDPRDIQDFLSGKGVVYGTDDSGGEVELSIKNNKDYQYMGGDEDMGARNHSDEIFLDDLDFETLKAAFPNNYQKEKFTRSQTGEPYYSDSISFPNLDDSMMEIGDSEALNDWKDKVSRRFGNVIIKLNDEGKNWFDKVFVDDEEFNTARDKFIQGKMSAMQGDMDKGRNID